MCTDQDQFVRLLFVVVFSLFVGCVASKRAADEGHPAAAQGDALTIDPVTGVPYAFTFQFPVAGFDTSDFGFGFGAINSNFCLASNASGCTQYGAHTGRDTIVGETPVGTEVVAPADGIVRITTDQTFGGYGSDAAANPQYRGCLLLIEHEFANGQGVLSLLGHVACEHATMYDAAKKQGNPAVGSIVKRGQYVAHVTHYWHGAGQSTDWHHLHWGMRKGAYSAASLDQEVKGYVAQSEFKIDPMTQALVNPSWLDPFVIVAADGDPATQAAGGVRHHPSGTLLEDAGGAYWLVMDQATVASVSNSVMAQDRYDVTTAVKATDVELGCYSKATPIVSAGHVTLYQRPGSSTVVMAYDASKTRYDVIRWEALVSWGFGANDLTSDQKLIASIESKYSPLGLRTLRPGTLVKADESSEVAVVTVQGTRIPIASGDVFEAMGFRWERVVSIPQAVLDQVAGPRVTPIIDQVSISACAVTPACPGGGNCGGGGDPDPEMDAGTSMGGAGGNSSSGTGGAASVEICNGLDDNGNGQVDEIFECVLGATDGPGCTSTCNTSGSRVCEAPSCSWGACKPFAENCSNTLDDDCNGKTDCDDPACVMNDACKPAGTGGSGGAPNVSGGSAAVIHLSYVGPSSPGTISLQAWWQPPMAAPHAWGPVSACVDTVKDDGALDCTFDLPHGTTSFEFQVTLPNGAYWGDESCGQSGGCGNTVGDLTLASDGAPLAYQLVPNNPNGQPYMNGHVDLVP